MAVSLSVAILGVTLGPVTPLVGPVPAATGLARISAGSAIERVPPPNRQPGSEAQKEDDHDEHQRGGPGVPMPFLIGTGGIGEHREWQRRHRLIDIEAQVLAAQRGEEEWGGF